MPNFSSTGCITDQAISHEWSQYFDIMTHLNNGQDPLNQGLVHHKAWTYEG